MHQAIANRPNDGLLPLVVRHLDENFVPASFTGHMTGVDRTCGSLNIEPATLTGCANEPLGVRTFEQKAVSHFTPIIDRMIGGSLVWRPLERIGAPQISPTRLH